MTEEMTPPVSQSQLSFSDKFVGILSSPGETYAAIAQQTEPNKSNWVLPLIITILVSIAFTFIVFSQPPIQDQMMEVQRKSMEKMVTDGRLTQDQMEMAAERNFAKPGSPMFFIFGSVGVTAVMCAMLFGYSLAYWLGGKMVYKSTLSYSKMLEIYGLSMLVLAVSSIISMVFVIPMGSLYAGPSLAMMVENFDPQNSTHKIMAAVNLLSFWHLFVVTIGLSKVWNVSFGKALGVSGVVWVAWTLISAFLGFGG